MLDSAFLAQSSASQSPRPALLFPRQVADTVYRLSAPFIGMFKIGVPLGAVASVSDTDSPIF